MLDNVTPNPQQVPHHSVDSSDMPKWGRAGDGSFVKLVADADLQVAFAAWQADACQHPKEQQFTGKTVNGGGVDVYRRYCRSCGAATTQSLSHRSVEHTAIVIVDTAARDKRVDKYIKHRRDQLDEIANAAADRQQPERRADYADYLNSPEWAEKRAAVMDRCDGVCEGCRKRTATDVHHLTYRNVRREFLFELVGMCRECHARWHEQAE